MKISRFLSIVGLVTILALLYVHQNIKLVVTSYEIRTKEKLLSQLLDQNKVLAYNIMQLKSPGHLEGCLLAKGAKFELPYPWQIVEVTGKEEERKAKLEKGKRNRFSLFALRREAEALNAE